jgi:hypothetical protein
MPIVFCLCKYLYSDSDYSLLCNPPAQKVFSGRDLDGCHEAAVSFLDETHKFWTILEFFRCGRDRAYPPGNVCVKKGEDCVRKHVVRSSRRSYYKSSGGYYSSHDFGV